MKPVFTIEIKSSGSYFMTSINGRNFRHNGRALRQKYRPFIEVIKYSPSDFISTIALRCDENFIIWLLYLCYIAEF